MYLSLFALFVLAHAVSVFAAGPTSGFDVLTSPLEQASFAVGSTLPIVWQPGTSTGTITIYLTAGKNPNLLDKIDTIASKIDTTSGSYNWTIPSSVGAYGAYGLNLTLDANPSTFQYSNGFHITGGSSVSSSSGTGTSSSTGTSAVPSTSSSATGGYFITSPVSSSTPASGSTTTPTSSVASSTSAATTSSGAAKTSLVPSFSNATISNTQSQTSSTSSSSTLSPTTKPNGASGNIVSTSLALISAFFFALAL